MFGWSWEMAWAAHTGDWVRVAQLHEWLNSLPPLYPKTQPTLRTVGEFYSYDCIRGGAHDQAGCDGDPGNGVMVGWFLWAQTLVRRKLGLQVAFSP